MQEKENLKEYLGSSKDDYSSYREEEGSWSIASFAFDLPLELFPFLVEMVALRARRAGSKKHKH